MGREVKNFRTWGITNFFGGRLLLLDGWGGQYPITCHV